MRLSWGNTRWPILPVAESGHCQQRSRPRGTVLGILAAAVVLFACPLMLTCVQRRPVEPGPVKYNVYFGSSGYNNIYVVDLDSLLLSSSQPPILDSFPGFEMITDMVVSDDGCWMYAESNYRRPPFSPSLRKINLLTRDIVGSLPSRISGRLTLLDGGRLLVRGYKECRREVIDATTFTVLDSLPDSTCGCKGPRTGTKLAALVGGTSRVRGLDLERGTYWGEYIAHAPSGQTLHVTDAFLHPNDTLVAAIATSGGQVEVWFLVGSLLTGETVASARLTRATGTVCISADGNWCVATEAGHEAVGGPLIVYVFDLRSNRLAARLTHLEGMEAVPSNTLFLGGDRYAIVWPQPPAGGPIALIDVENLGSARTIELPFSNLDMGGLGTGPR